MAMPAVPYAVEDFADKLNIVSAPFVLNRQEEVSDIGSGEFLTADLGPALYGAQVETAAMTNARAHQLMALIEALGGSRECFYLYDPMMPYPQADPDGSILGGAAPTIHTIAVDRRSMRVTGLPSGYVLTVGDYLAVDYGDGRRALIRAGETVTASAGGLTPLFGISMALRPGITTTLGVMLKKPAAKVKMRPGTLAIRPVDLVNAAISFAVRQTLAAG